MPRVRPSVHSSAHTSARLLAVVFALVFAFAAVALVCVEPPASSACPISMPSPLRVRYADSTIVAVARVGDSVGLRRENMATLMNTALHITSLLKGESKEKVVKLQHVVITTAGGNSVGEYEKDDVLLVFLRRVEKGDVYVSVDGERGVQKLPDEDLKVYVRRIEELAAIMQSEKPDEAALIEWLVRCAEEPATRWEGAFELAFNATLPQDPQDEEDGEAGETGEAETETADAVSDDEKETEDNGSSVEPAGAVESGNVESNDQLEVVPAFEQRLDPSINFAALLTPAQKERLTTTLLNAEELDKGEQLLVRLVGSWKDERLVPFLLKHLARSADKPPYHAEDMMRIVAHTLGDQTLVKLVSNYTKTASYEDLYAGDPVDASNYVEDPTATPEERAERKKEFEEMNRVAAEALFQRSGKFRHFLALADQPQKP